ncbi:MAG: hypothetical protein GQ565_03880 [Candidatus Aegiribacteria sp.]|nr:hypothetical protein [Candidatus Aegiribacteria sp.]
MYLTIICGHYSQLCGFYANVSLSGRLLVLVGEVWKVLAECHRCRNQPEYEGILERDEQLLTDHIAVIEVVFTEVRLLPDRLLAIRVNAGQWS